MYFENVVCKKVSIWSRPQCVKVNVTFIQHRTLCYTQPKVSRQEQTLIIILYIYVIYQPTNDP